MSTIKPTGDRLLVSPTKTDRNPSGKVVIPNTVSKWEGDGDHEFWVCAVGPKVVGIKPRDRIVCQFDHDGVEPVYAGDIYRRGFIRQANVLMVFTNSPEDDPPATAER